MGDTRRHGTGDPLRGCLDNDRWDLGPSPRGYGRGVAESSFGIFAHATAVWLMREKTRYTPNEAFGSWKKSSGNAVTWVDRLRKSRARQVKRAKDSLRLRLFASTPTREKDAMSAKEKSPSTHDRLITKAELASRLNLSTRSIDRKIEDGSIPRGIRLGGAVRWRESVIDRWIDGGCPQVIR
jgi:predicted DNA-binding transcriptional regulator AlpA